MKKFLSLLIIIVFSISGCNNTKEINDKQLPLQEAEIINLMNEKMDIQGWNITRDGEIITFSYSPKDTIAEGVSFSVNSKTGTVYEYISGAPQTNLVIENSPNFKDIHNGTIYYSEIYKLANPIIESNNLLPVPSKDNWIAGGYGDGYLFGEVKKSDREFFIKFDIFTKEWEEIESPF